MRDDIKELIKKLDGLIRYWKAKLEITRLLIGETDKVMVEQTIKELETFRDSLKLGMS